jgi:hypothetical protein
MTCLVETLTSSRMTRRGAGMAKNFGTTALADLQQRIMDRIRAAQAAAGAAKDGYTYIVGMWSDRAVVSMGGSNDKMLSYPYTEDAGGGVTLGTPVEVVMTYLPKPEAVKEAAGALTGVELPEAGAADKPLRFSVRVIRAGVSVNNNYYSDAVLREAVPLFNGTRVFVKGDKEHLASAGKDVRNLIGQITEARFIEGAGKDTGEILAVLTVIDRNDPTAVKMREAATHGMTDLFGLSIDATADVRAGKVGGKVFREATTFKSIKSVDVIVEPGAGGGVVALLEAAGANEPEEDGDVALRETLIARLLEAAPGVGAAELAGLSDDDLVARLAEAKAPKATDGGGADDVARLVEARITSRMAALDKARDRINKTTLPQPAKVRLIARLEQEGEFREAAVDDAIKEEAAYLVSIGAGGGRVSGLGGAPFIESMEDRGVKMGDMLDAFFDPKHKDHRKAQSFKECYAEITGDSRVTGRLRDCDDVRLREALGTDSFDALLGDAMNRRMIADYRAGTALDVYRRLVNVVPVNDFREQSRLRWGGYGDLPVVEERQAYEELSSPGDDAPAKYKLAKRGGVESVSLEMIRNDDVGLIRQVPIKLGRSAKRTLSRAVMMSFVDDTPIYDGQPLFANHAKRHNLDGASNLGAAALNANSLAARRLNMKRRAAFGETEPLGLLPKTLLVPDALEQAGFDLFRRGTEQDKTFVSSMNLEVAAVWCWENPTGWGLAGDPMDGPMIELGFLDGNEEPEMFVQDAPNSGSLFHNDAITYKIRHVWAFAWLDWRNVDFSQPA